MRKTLAFLVLAFALIGFAVRAATINQNPLPAGLDVNFDVTNKGTQTAYDIALVLAGNETNTGRFDGWPDVKFSSFTSTFDGSQTTFHWEYPYYGASIPNGTKIHVGYSTADRTSRLVDAYWTDENGKRIPGGGVDIVLSHPVATGATFYNDLGRRVRLSDIRYADVAVAVALADLSSRNPNLMGSLHPAGPISVELAPGQSFTVPLPVAPAGTYRIVVTRTVGLDDGSAAEVENFVQARIQ